MATKQKEDIFENKDPNRKKITKRDFIASFMHSWFLQASWNYERMQNLGFLVYLLPVLKRLYPNKKDLSVAMDRHMEFFNTQPFAAPPIAGLIMALEEDRANGSDVTDKDMQNIKVGMMGPLAGVGDPIFWGTLRPIIGAFAASLAASGSIIGPILFFLLWNVVTMVISYYLQYIGYKQGYKLAQNLTGNLLQTITKFAGIVGMFVMGVLVPRWTTMNFSMTIATTTNTPVADGGTYVDLSQVQLATNGHVDAQKTYELMNNLISGTYTAEKETAITLQSTLDSLLPGLAPLLLLFLMMFLLRKRLSPILLIILLFVFGIIMAALGVMS